MILPGSKDTLADLEWLRTTGLDAAILAAHRRGALILGVCGGYQMLGRSLSDPGGVAGQAGNAVPGLGLLPVETVFLPEKEVRTVRATFADDSWTAYEIHMGRSRIAPQTAPLFHIHSGGDPLPSFEGTPDSSGSGDALPEVSRPGALGPDGASEGVRFGRVWGTYLHGAFESAAFRSAVTREAGIHAHRPAAGSFRQQRQKLYADMADFIEEHLNLEDLWRYVAH